MGAILDYSLESEGKLCVSEVIEVCLVAREEVGILKKVTCGHLNI